MAEEFGVTFIVAAAHGDRDDVIEFEEIPCYQLSGPTLAERIHYGCFLRFTPKILAHSVGIFLHW